jgi:Methyltransferase domain
VDFNAFALSHLPSPPARVLEIGCGKTGELALALDAAGYDVLALDPLAPAGPIFRRITLDELDDPGPFDAAIAARVLHHVSPLEPAVAKLAALAPLLIVDEFAWDRVDEATKEWYDRENVLREGPDLDRWREEHADLHPSGHVRAALRERFGEDVYEERPYLYRWLKESGVEAREQELIEARAIQPLGYRLRCSRRS